MSRLPNTAQLKQNMGREPTQPPSTFPLHHQKGGERKAPFTPEKVKISLNYPQKDRFGKRVAQRLKTTKFTPYTSEENIVLQEGQPDVYAEGSTIIDDSKILFDESTTSENPEVLRALTSKSWSLEASLEDFLRFFKGGVFEECSKAKEKAQVASVVPKQDLQADDDSGFIEPDISGFGVERLMIGGITEEDTINTDTITQGGCYTLESSRADDLRITERTRGFSFAENGQFNSRGKLPIQLNSNSILLLIWSNWKLGNFSHFLTFLLILNFLMLMF